MSIWSFRSEFLAGLTSSTSCRKNADLWSALSKSIFISIIALALLASAAYAKQGAVRALYTVPNMTFIEQPTGENVVTINDTSGSISSLQSAIDYFIRKPYQIDDLVRLIDSTAS